MQLEESKEASEKKIKKERRTFLKKVVYTAPSLVVLGSLAKPSKAKALGYCQYVGQSNCEEPPF